MFKLYFLTYVADVVASVTLNYQLIQNSLEFENLIFFYLKIKRVQILKNNIKNSFYKGIGALAPYKTPLRVVRQINTYKTRSLIYYYTGTR
jgi:hypothetical protein